MSKSLESVDPRETMFDFNLASDDIVTSPLTVGYLDSLKIKKKKREKQLPFVS